MVARASDMKRMVIKKKKKYIYIYIYKQRNIIISNDMNSGYRCYILFA